MRLKEIIPGDEHNLIFAGIDFTNPDAEDPPYEFIHDRMQLKTFMDQKLLDYNDMFKKAPMNLVLFKDACEHCCKILRVLRQPRGNALLVGIGGSGRHCQTRLASFIATFIVTASLTCTDAAL